MTGGLTLSRLPLDERLAGRLLYARGGTQTDVMAALLIPAAAASNLRHALGPAPRCNLPPEDGCRTALERELGTGSQAIWDHMRHAADGWLRDRLAGLPADHPRRHRLVALVKGTPADA